MPITSQQKPGFAESLSALSLLQSGVASITAERVALQRAAHQVLDRPLVFEDLMALAIVGRPDALAQSDNLNGPESRYIRAFMAARSRYAEDELALALQDGIDQYVILGAGLDTYAYRSSTSASGLTIYEVDHPATQAWKRERLATECIAVPTSLRFVSIDFETQSLEDVLTERGFDIGKPAFFSWLGVTPYLTASAFESTLRFIASRAPRSSVVFDYAVAHSALNPMERYILEGLAKRVTDVGEPFKLFFEPSKLSAQLRERGFANSVDLGTQEINARYFSGRADGLQVLGNFARLTTATV